MTRFVMAWGPVFLVDKRFFCCHKKKEKDIVALLESAGSHIQVFQSSCGPESMSRMRQTVGKGLTR